MRSVLVTGRFTVRDATEADRAAVAAFLRNTNADAAVRPALLALADGRLAGVLSHVAEGTAVEVLGVHAAERSAGAERALLDGLLVLAARQGRERIRGVDDLEISVAAWGFAEPGPLRDELTAAALAGTKTSTSSLLVEYTVDPEPVPLAGERSVLLDSSERPVGVIETTEVRVLRMADVDDAFAIEEGEGYAGAAEWRASHERYWNRDLARLRSGLGDPDFALDDDTLVVAERFRLVGRVSG